ncbi:hypothetical protein [Cupriavidus sp. DF5525]|uniref:hypothetical protein n=1 Tax=Cupriavidus sp. DF5525 TaxID=3160989 RepID=UPI0032DEB40F
MIYGKINNPGATNTDRVKNALETESRLTGKSEAELLKANEDRIPLGRYARPEEVAPIPRVELRKLRDCGVGHHGWCSESDGGVSASKFVEGARVCNWESVRLVARYGSRPASRLLKRCYEKSRERLFAAQQGPKGERVSVGATRYDRDRPPNI